ncbi:MAG: hypothetical protein V7K48_12230 [Nostoc sp.]
MASQPFYTATHLGAPNFEVGFRAIAPTPALELESDEGLDYLI